MINIYSCIYSYKCKPKEDTIYLNILTQKLQCKHTTFIKTQEIMSPPKAIKKAQLMDLKKWNSMKCHAKMDDLLSEFQ
jgi:hypothetical protein